MTSRNSYEELIAIHLLVHLNKSKGNIRYGVSQYFLLDPDDFDKIDRQEGSHKIGKSKAGENGLQPGQGL